jgi:hypothetical protein
VLAGTLSLFTAKYPAVTNYFPVGYQAAPWDLGNGGDTVNLHDASGTLVCSVLLEEVIRPTPGRGRDAHGCAARGEREGNLNLTHRAVACEVLEVHFRVGGDLVLALEYARLAARQSSDARIAAASAGGFSHAIE